MNPQQTECEHFVPYTRTEEWLVHSEYGLVVQRLNRLCARIVAEYFQNDSSGKVNRIVDIALVIDNGYMGEHDRLACTQGGIEQYGHNGYKPVAQL
ncbi:unnamed protein product [Sphagnum balticum]